MSDVLLGIGLATGMFYHAPKGTAYPAYPGETLGASWKHVGDVTQDGVTLATDKSTEALKNWANVVKRIVLSDHNETLQAPVMDTTEEVFKTIVGPNHVSVTAANAQHGKLIAVDLSTSELPPEEEFLFLMKDGDDMMMLGCTGQIMSVDNVSFAPANSINWTPTITVLENSLQFITDDGKKAISG